MSSAQSSQSVSSVRLWDLPVRLFHVLLITLITLQYASGEFGLLNMNWHFYLGYATLALILFRILWGFFGSDTARFVNFVRGPRAIVQYMRGLFSTNSQTVIGHNPLGGWSVIAMLICIAIQSITGLFTTDDISEYGPLAEKVSTSMVEVMTRVHHLGQKFLITLIILHLLAIIFYRVFKKENLIWPMITGNKRGIIEIKPLHFVGLGRALLLLIISGGIVAAVVKFGTG